MNLKDIPDKPLRPYQIEDIETLTQRLQTRPATFALHEQGLGKSRIALNVAHRLGAKRTLIHCPKIALISWAEEIATWTDASFQIIAAGKDVKKLRRDADITVCTFDLARNDDVRQWLAKWAADFAINDEAQYLRNHEAKRTRAVYSTRRDQPGTLAAVPKALIMSGTIVVSWPMDLWTHLARWAPDRITVDGARMSPETFLRRYHITREVSLPGTNATRTQIVRTQNADDLHARLDGLAIRRRKADVAKDLPPISWRTTGLEFTRADGAKLREVMIDAGVKTELIDAFTRLSNEGEVERATRLLIDSTESVSTMTRILGEAKAMKLGKQLADEMSETTYAVGVGFWNKAVGDALEEALAKFGVVRVDGQTSQARRQDAVDRFRDPAGPRVFLGQIAACGTALTLVRASRVVCAQLSWTPGENSQFTARFHRIGQTEPVDVRVPVFHDTIDDAFQRVVMRKSAAAAAVIEGVN